MSSPSSDIPNLGNIADTLQNISRSFSNLCNELGRLENLPSVDLLTQLKTLNESIAVKEEQKEIRAQLVGSEEKTNRLEEQVKKLSQTVASLESQLVLAQKERDTFQSKIDDHLAAMYVI
jgi:chromosome segregation ATPase